MIDETDIRIELNREPGIGRSDHITLTHIPTSISVTGSTENGRYSQLMVKAQLMLQLDQEVQEYRDRA
jgi:protein subunit release factor A